MAHSWAPVMCESLSTGAVASFIPCWYGVPGMTGAGSGDVGSPVDGMGPGGRAVYLDAGQQVTWSVSGTSVDVMYPTASIGGTMGVSIDGAAKPTVSGQGESHDGLLDSFDGLAAGTHTVTVSATSGGVVVDGVIAYPAGRSSGIRLIDASKWGITAADVATGGYDGVSLSTWLAAVTPDLVIVELGANDWSTGATISAFSASLESIMSTISSSAASSDVMVLGIQRRSDVSTSATPSWDDYLTAMAGSASSHSAAFVNLDSLLGHAADHPADFASNFHPNDSGHAKIADTVGGMLRTAAGL